MASRSDFLKFTLTPHLSPAFLCLTSVALGTRFNWYSIERALASIAVSMASVEMCERNLNLMPSCDDLFGSRIHMLSVSCSFEIFTTLFGYKKIITVSLDKCALLASKQKSSARPLLAHSCWKQWMRSYGEADVHGSCPPWTEVVFRRRKLHCGPWTEVASNATTPHLEKVRINFDEKLRNSRENK